MREDVTLHAKSSDGSSKYEVRFILEDGLLRISCECKAGLLGKHCRHKWELLNGNDSMLYFESESDLLRKVSGWAEENGVAKLYDRIKMLERQIAGLKLEVKAEKLEVARKMKEGF